MWGGQAARDRQQNLEPKTVTCGELVGTRAQGLLGASVSTTKRNVGLHSRTRDAECIQSPKIELERFQIHHTASLKIKDMDSSGGTNVYAGIKMCEGQKTILDITLRTPARISSREAQCPMEAHLQPLRSNSVRKPACYPGKQLAADALSQKAALCHESQGSRSMAALARKQAPASELAPEKLSVQWRHISNHFDVTLSGNLLATQGRLACLGGILVQERYRKDSSSLVRFGRPMETLGRHYCGSLGESKFLGPHELKAILLFPSRVNSVIKASTTVSDHHYILGFQGTWDPWLESLQTIPESVHCRLKVRVRMLGASGPKTEMKGSQASLPGLEQSGVHMTHVGPSQYHPLSMARRQSNIFTYTGSRGIEILWQPSTLLSSPRQHPGPVPRKDPSTFVMIVPPVEYLGEQNPTLAHVAADEALLMTVIKLTCDWSAPTSHWPETTHNYGLVLELSANFPAKGPRFKTGPSELLKGSKCTKGIRRNPKDKNAESQKKKMKPRQQTEDLSMKAREEVTKAGEKEGIKGK
ncbi:hypothetical protein ACRRTK_001846 [Alexandromys fortis]